MLKPLQEFICDSCRNPITDIENGWVEWESFGDENKGKLVSRNFRICHHETKCQKLARHLHCHDTSLKEFIGDKAIIRMMKMLDIGPYHGGEYMGPEPEDMREFVEFYRRLILPYYEEARQWWSEAMSDGYFGDLNEIDIYMPNNLKAMIEHYKK